MFLRVLVVLIGLAAAQPASAADRMWTYDPADAATRALVDNGLTVLFDKGLFGIRVREVLSNQASATARLEPASERDLGARLAGVLPEGAFASQIYAVLPEAEGSAMVRALCPGSSRGWLVFGPMRERRDLKVHALGDDPATGAPRHCAELTLRFRNAWGGMVRDPRLPRPRITRGL